MGGYSQIQVCSACGADSGAFPVAGPLAEDASGE